MLAYLSWYVVWWTRYVAFFNGRQCSRPVIPSLGDYFPCGSIDLGKYVLFSSALRQRARWRTSLAMLFGGQGMLPFLMTDNAVDTDAHRVSKRKRSILSMRGGTQRMDRRRLFRPRIQCGLSFTSLIYTSPKMQSSQRHFTIASAFRIHNFLN